MSEIANPSSAAPSLTTTASGGPTRDFTLWSAFALAFSDVSPIVGIFGIFAISLVAGGPAFFWALPLVLIFQLVVTGVFGELVSKWPFQGSVGAWSRHMIGPRYGWFTQWAYMWGLTLVLPALALAAAGYLLGALGVDAPSHITVVLVGLVIILLASAVNMVGRGLLKTLFYISMAAELAASLGIGTALLFFHRTNPWSVLFSTGGTGSGLSWLFNPFLAVVAFVGFSFVGFESAGSIAEEVKESRRVLPKAISLSLAAAGLLVMYASLGLILAAPSLSDVISGKVADPISSTLEARLGSAVGRVLLTMLTIGFTASLLAVQTAVTRAIWAGARDRTLPGSGILRRMSGPEHLPRYAIGLTAIIGAPLLFISATRIYALLLTFGTAGFFISYALPILGAAYVRLRGRWSPGESSMGRWGAPVTYVAAVWIVLETVNIAWPRAVNGVWYLDWGLIIMTVVLGLIGAVISARVFRAGGPSRATVVDPEGP